MIMKNEFGIVYIATGNKYIAECKISAKSAKKVMPNIPISIWTDQEIKKGKDYFDNIEIIQSPTYSFFDKIKPLEQSKYDKTLFVDTDTYFLDSIYELSQLLDHFDLAYCHAPWRISPGENGVIGDEIPICFPEPNTGVILYRKTEQVLQLIRNWGNIYAEQLKQNNPPSHDQPAFRKALYFSEIRCTVLPTEYNLRTVFPVFKGGGCTVKILHGRDPSLTRAINTVNTKKGVNCYDFTDKRSIKHKLNKLKRKLIR